MTAHPYNLRSRLSNSSLSSKAGPTSPVSRAIRSSRKEGASTLKLEHVIGTTTSTPGGLSCCNATESYAYAAGSVTVFASINSENNLSFRYYKARPTVLPINPISSFYDSPSSTSTPTRKRTTFLPSRGVEDYNASAYGRDRVDEGIGQTWSARERIKTVTCVSISPDGRMLAVGETGYNPRVLLFSTASNTPTDTPLTIIVDHTIGVRCVAFSSDSKFLATLGDVNDGFLYMWEVNTRSGSVRLHSSNKCTTNVCDMTWCGDSVVTVGTRHIKIWQVSTSDIKATPRKSRIRHEIEVPSPGPATLQGRNCLLGTFADSIFTAITAISPEQAVISADDGRICLLDLSQGTMTLMLLANTESSIAAISCRQDPQRLVWADGRGSLEERDLLVLRRQETGKQLDRSLSEVRGRRRMSRESLLRQSFGMSPLKRASTVALGCLRDKIVCIAADAVLRVARTDTYDIEADFYKMSSHSGSVKGVGVLPSDESLGSFFTWAKNGEIRFWSKDVNLLRAGMVELDEGLEVDDTVSNELKVVKYLPSCKSLVTGDQLGVLKLVDVSWTCSQNIRAHGAEITSIDTHEAISMLATGGRDRMVQIFSIHDQRLELLQTSDDHISAVTQVLFTRNGNQLLSCSADRTIVIRERIGQTTEQNVASAFLSARTVTLKAAPLSMSLVPDTTDSLAISTMDRHLVKVNLSTGMVTTGFKFTDPGSDDTVFSNSICLSKVGAPDDRCLLVGYSSIDKSIRIYDFEKGVLLSRDSGHVEGVSDIATIESCAESGTPGQLRIISTGLDGTTMIWSVQRGGQPILTPQQERLQTQSLGIDPEKTKMTPASLPPLRRILSKVDMTNLTRQHSPTREKSPNSLKRKTSRFALITAEEEPGANCHGNGLPLHEAKLDLAKRSPSPPTRSTIRAQKQRSQSEMKEVRLRQSPSPPRPLVAAIMPAKQSVRANNSRLRRPPSIPMDLRAQTATQDRRQSMSNAQDLGSFKTATDQTCRMLKTYRKRLQAHKDITDLEEIELELDAVLRMVRQKGRLLQVDEVPHTIITKAERHDDPELDGLATMLERTSV